MSSTRYECPDCEGDGRWYVETDIGDYEDCICPGCNGHGYIRLPTHIFEHIMRDTARIAADAADPDADSMARYNRD